MIYHRYCDLAYITLFKISIISIIIHNKLFLYNIYSLTQTAHSKTICSTQSIMSII